MTLVRPIAAAATALLLLAGCTSPETTTDGTTPSSTPSATAAPSTPPAGPTTTLTPSPETSASTAPTPNATITPPPAADVTVQVVLRDGKITPNGDNVRVQDGQRVQISLDSDAAESIHVHGYDKTVEVKPGGTDEVTFLADQKGVFEVETHETAKLVVKLIVS